MRWPPYSTPDRTLDKDDTELMIPKKYFVLKRIEADFWYLMIRKLLLEDHG